MVLTVFDVETVKAFNILILGVVFMFIFTGFNTMTGIQAMIFKSATTEGSGGFVEGFEGNGFISSAIVYAVFSLASWVSPSIIACTGPRLAMFLAGILYIQYIAQLLHPNTYLLYLGSAVVGLGSPVLWTAQGTFISLNSDKDTIARNSGIVWALFQTSTFFGNIFVYFMFSGEEFISSSVRSTVGLVLLSITSVGTLCTMLLRPVYWGNTEREGEKPVTALKNSVKLFLTNDMMILCIVFFYTGLQLSMWSGVFPTCVGFTTSLGQNRKAFATICMICIATGEVLGGTVFGFFGRLTTKMGRSPIIILGFVTSLVSYLLIFINLPPESTLGETAPSSTAVIQPNRIMIGIAALVMGFSDSCFNTQIMSLLGEAFKSESTSAFAIFKFIQSLSAAIAFFYSPYVFLSWQLLALTILSTLGSLAFYTVDRNRAMDVNRSDYQLIE